MVDVQVVLIHGEGGTVNHLGTPLGVAGEHTSVQMPFG